VAKYACTRVSVSIKVRFTWLFDIFPDFYCQNRGGSKLTRGSSQVNLTLIETETRVQAYFATPFLNFKIFLKVHKNSAQNSRLLCFKKMYYFREKSNFPFSNQKIITLVYIRMFTYQKLAIPFL
jgi:hypothetical protein